MKKNVNIKKYVTRDHITGLILSILGIAGLLHTIFGREWSRVAGVGTKLFPQISFSVVLIMGIAMLAEKGKGDQPKGTLSLLGVRSVLLFTLLGILYFLLILKIGLIVATVIYTFTVFSILTVNPLKRWKQIIFPSAIVTLIIWVLFNWLIELILPIPLLF